MESIKTVLGAQFKGTVIEDPVLEPYFITNSAGSFAVSKKRLDKSGNLRFSDVCYPSTFKGCLDKVAKEKLHEEDGKFYTSIQEYMDRWESISKNIVEAYKGFNIE